MKPDELLDQWINGNKKAVFEVLRQLPPLVSASVAAWIMLKLVRMYRDERGAAAFGAQLADAASAYVDSLPDDPEDT